MFYVLQNESTAALRRVPILLTDAATGQTAQTGIALTTIFPYVNINGGAFIGGTGSVAESGFGQYYYEMALGETNTLGLAGIHITAAGCRNYDAIAQISAFNMYSAAGLGLTAGDVWSYDISGITAAGSAGTQLNLAAAGGGASLTAADVWTYDYITPGVVPQSAAERLEDTRTNTYTIDGNTSNIASNVWNRDPIGSGDNTTGDYYSAYLYQLGIGATGYAGTSITAGDVWSYAGGRTITGGIADTVTDVTNGVIVTTNNDKTGYALSSTQTFDLTGNISGSVGSVTADVNVSTASMAGVANTVWSTLTAPYTTHATFGHNLLRSDNAATIGEVTLHQSGGSKRVDADVHAFVNNTASATAMLNILTGIGASITSNITGSVSGSVGSVIGSVGSVTAAVSLSTATQASIANSVWLTDVTSYVAPSAGEDLATAAVGGISPADVWTYASRTITGGLADTVTTLTNRSGFAITGGTITTVSDKTGYSLSGSQTFNLTGNITGNVSGSVGSVSGAVGSVTGAVGSVTGNVGGNVVGSVASVTAPVSITTAAMGSIGSTVWNYVLSDAQSADTNLVAAGAGGIALTAGDVWSYNTRTLTSGAGITVIGAVQLVNGPYKLTSNQNNSDGILDILQNSVQEINLNLIDGNGSPASTAGYGAIINIFDVAGVAVTSYTPTVEYADGGILTFELDTDVTATIGRYNLIVALSGAGFNVKYGPLQILVRPL